MKEDGDDDGDASNDEKCKDDADGSGDEDSDEQAARDREAIEADVREVRYQLENLVGFKSSNSKS